VQPADIQFTAGKYLQWHRGLAAGRAEFRFLLRGPRWPAAFFIHQVYICKAPRRLNYCISISPCRQIRSISYRAHRYREECLLCILLAMERPEAWSIFNSASAQARWNMICTQGWPRGALGSFLDASQSYLCSTRGFAIEIANSKVIKIMQEKKEASSLGFHINILNT
jgi:hypothetical protein